MVHKRLMVKMKNIYYTSLFQPKGKARYILVVLFLGTSYLGLSQTLEREVISCGGNTIENTEVTLSITLGQLMHETYSTSDVLLATGMEQQLDLFTLSVVELVDMKLTLYPNPTASRLYIRSDQYINELNIMNGMGQKVKTIEVDGFTKTLQVAELPVGIYFIQINQNDTQTTTKFIKI